MFLENLQFGPLFTLGLLLIGGFIFGKLVGLIRLPEITGFILAGLVMGDSVAGLISHEMGSGLQLVTELALGLIALTIGSEFAWPKLKRLGSNMVVITVVQIAATFGVVALALFLFRVPLHLALLMGAVAAATAPAATVAIIQSLRAKGEFVDYLYGIVALDDAGSVILFGGMLAVASAISGGDAHAGEVVLEAVSEVGFSILLGVVAGFLIHVAAFRRRNEDGIMITTLGILLIDVAIAVHFHLSPLLANMIAGAVVINLSSENRRVFRIMSALSPPIFALFFIIAGTELRPEILLQPTVLIIGAVYIISRAIGKYGGVYVGCLLTGAPANIRNYLGISFLPQAGVALGLVLVVQSSALAVSMPILVANMVNVVLLSVFVNELIGPPLSRFAVIRGTR